MANTTKQVIIRGVTYPTQAAAAKAFGVTEGAISVARKRGSLDALGEGSGGFRAVAVTIGGLRFRSMEEAGRFYGVTSTTIRNWIASGKAARLGNQPRNQQEKEDQNG